jgi:hypothetical protein
MPIALESWQALFSDKFARTAPQPEELPQIQSQLPDEGQVEMCLQRKL